jgi:hypothetical protein
MNKMLRSLCEPYALVDTVTFFAHKDILTIVWVVIFYFINESSGLYIEINAHITNFYIEASYIRGSNYIFAPSPRNLRTGPTDPSDRVSPKATTPKFSQPVLAMRRGD